MFNNRSRIAFFRSRYYRQLAQREGSIQLVVVIIIGEYAQRVVVSKFFGQSYCHFTGGFVDGNFAGFNPCAVVVNGKRIVVYARNGKQCSKRLKRIVFDCRLFFFVVAIFVGNFERKRARFFTFSNVHVADIGSKHINCRFTIQCHYVVEIHGALGSLVELCQNIRLRLFFFCTRRHAVVIAQRCIVECRPHELYIIDAERTCDTPSTVCTGIYAHLAVVEMPTSANGAQVYLIGAVFFGNIIKFGHYRKGCSRCSSGNIGVPF